MAISTGRGKSSRLEAYLSSSCHVDILDFIRMLVAKGVVEISILRLFPAPSGKIVVSNIIFNDVVV